ncbi:MAG: acyltransferase [Phycisphaerae bacterium]|nr:acyltransferase [Phycisphaerae bacterium]
MSTVLSTCTNSRDNNFNLVRFIAALLVLYTHSFAITLGTGDAEPLKSTLGMTWGNIAVDIFFVTSGLLITSSYFTRNNLLHFAWARILRIYPALIAAILFCVFIVGLSFTTISPWEYLSHEQTSKFLIKNTLLVLGLEYTLPGVFANIPLKDAVNGSLWTLPHEVEMYGLLAIILCAMGTVQKRFRMIGQQKHYLLLIAIAAMIADIINHFQAYSPTRFIHLFSMFFVGAAYYAWRDHVRLSSMVFVLTLSALLVSSLNAGVFFVLYLIILPYLTLFAAYVPSGRIRKFNAVGDYSYGMYIYAFPVQQSISQLVPGVSVANMIIMSFGVTFMLSMISWHFIEKRFLKMKGAYVVFEQWLRNLRPTSENST